jgi:DNA-binding transcriptional ArsR family regulator
MQHPQPQFQGRARPGRPSLLRELNDRAALDLLLGGETLTRSQISEYTGVSKVTVSQMLARLEERGLVAAVGEQAGNRGPNAALYSVVPSSAYVAGLYIDFDLVSAAVADVTGRRVAEVTVDPNGADDPVALVCGVVERACASARVDMARLSALVIGSPGVVDPRTGDPRLAVNLPAWHEGALDALRGVLHRPVVIENDVNLAAMAERAAGAAVGADDFVLVWLGVGLGLATFLGGRLQRGTSGAAGEIGYLPVHGAPLHTDIRHPASGGFQSLAGGPRGRLRLHRPDRGRRRPRRHGRGWLDGVRGVPRRTRAPGRGRGRLGLRGARSGPCGPRRRGRPGRRSRPRVPGGGRGGQHLAPSPAGRADRRPRRTRAPRRDARRRRPGSGRPAGLGRRSRSVNRENKP